jgi:3-deoxy-manno-octulosonate cytidylyltransferase (CMP-KDO synthetase)
VIPARYASERLPGKPLADILGKPMIQRVYEQVRQAALITRVIVATDDERIASVVRGFGGEAVMTPVECRSGSDRVALVARAMEDLEIVVNVQGDEPLLVPATIDEAVRPLIADPTIEVGTLVRKIEDPLEIDNPGIVKVTLDRRGFCLYFSRSPIPYVRGHAKDFWVTHQTFYKHVGLYVFRRKFLLTYASLAPTPLEEAEQLEQLRILEHGHRIRATVTTYDSIHVDTPEDLDRVRLLAEQQA